MARNQNFSSSEDFTESQNFDRFLNAEDSDAEDRALQTAVNKKMQAKGFYDNKGPATKTYPSYTGGASYSGNNNSQGYNGYATGYGNYGGGYTSSYGGGYGDNNYSGSASKQQGYGGYGTYGSGYGGTYGSGYGGGNAYSGYDATGYSGSGYGPSAGGGYKDEEDEDEYNDDEDEEENDKEGGGFELNMKEVMQRKAAQKAAKEAEEKKAEEEKAKKAKAALKSSVSSGSRKDTGKSQGKVSFNLGAEIHDDDSDNQNNQNISHITEQSHSSESSDMNNKASSKKKSPVKTEKDAKTASSSKMLLDMSDDDKKKDNLDSVDDMDSDYGKARVQNKSPPKKEEVSDSYADDFEESSKFGSSDYGKANLMKKEAEKKTEEFEESSNYLNESKDARFEATKKDNDANKPSEKVAATQEANKNFQNQDYQAISSLKQNYETRAAKDYVYESLLNDERRRVDKLENQLSLGGDQLKTVQQLIQEKDLTIHKLETENQNLEKELNFQKAEAHAQATRNHIYEIENENLQKRIEVLESKVKDLEIEKGSLVRANEVHAKNMKERREHLEKTFESKALSELKAQHENEKDLLLIRIEELQDENKKFREEVDKIREDARVYKTSFRQKAESDQEVKKLKQEIVLLELKLKDRDQIKQKKQPEVMEKEKENITLTSGIPELDKETQMQELLIKGFQKENEKLMTENKLLKKEIEELHGKIYDENKKMTEMKVRLVNNTDSVLITDKEIDIETRKMLGAENLMSKNDLQANQAKIAQLHKELQTREDTFKQREMEMKYEMDRLRAQKSELEARVGGVDMGSLKKQDEDYKQLVASVEQERRNYENEIRDLKSKLSWYINNQESLTAKEEVIRQKNEAIQKLEEEISKILSDPNTNLDAKTKHFNKVSNEDKKRIKQLERDVENLEDALKKRNPGLYDKMKNQQDESVAVKELKQSLKKVQEEKANLETEYETKLNDLRQKFDKMRLTYENKSSDPVASKTGKATENLENVEVLKSRIKELEKEVEDAKKYYLKKAQQLKDNKKGGKVVEKEKASKTSKEAGPASKKVQFDIKDDIEINYNDDKENAKGASNMMLDEERTNLFGKLINLQSTQAYTILNAFEDYKNNLINGFEVNNNQLIASTTQELSRVLNNSLSTFPQKEDILQRVKKIEQTANIDKKDPFPKVEELQGVLYDLLWAEMKKERSVLTAATSKPGAKLNNFFNRDQNPDSDVSNRKVSVLEEAAKKKDEELTNIQQKLAQIMSENAKLQKDKSNLELIIQQLPKNPRSLDFATMEKKLEIMERNYKEQELELKNAFKKAYNMDPFQTASETEKVKAAYEREISALRNALERKNQEILVFRQEMEIILKELNKLRRNKA